MWGSVVGSGAPRGAGSLLDCAGCQKTNLHLLKKSDTLLQSLVVRIVLE